MSPTSDDGQWLVADDLIWRVTAPEGHLMIMTFEQLDNHAAMQDGTLMSFSYQPAAIEGQPAQPRQYRVIKVERLPGT